LQRKKVKKYWLTSDKPGFDSCCQALLNKGVDIESRDARGCTPVLKAASAGHFDTVKKLVDSGADLFALSDNKGGTEFFLQIPHLQVFYTFLICTPLL
jgi:ankyrin repeat protein